ncbi:MAG: hypothetical protein KC912_22465 [Proteobacteria bacterium]|nr:hypothetical protein [Pseudomonadota bacterium]
MKNLPTVIALALGLAACGNETVIGDVPTPNDGSTCFLDISSAVPPTIDPECGAVDEVVDPWNVVEEWNFFGATGNNVVENSSYAPPLVARLTDTDGNGRITEDDHPNIVMVTFPTDLSGTREGSITVLDGVTEEVLWQTPGAFYASSHAIADVTGDGLPNVIAFDAGGRVMALDNEGEVLWTSHHSVASPYPVATIADLDADGRPEVIADNLVLHGVNGNLSFELVVDRDIPYTMPVVGDIDLDGMQEIIYGNAVHRVGGEVMWDTNLSGGYGHFSAILNADDDPEGEILMVGANRMVFFDTDGSELYRNDMARRGGSAPCIGDFDGDGESEIGIGGTDGNLSSDPALFQVYEIDGTLNWSREVSDQSGIAGCSGYDFDGDGAIEIVYADEGEFFIFDGETGYVRWSTTNHASGTVYEYPVIADVDLDGSAEILYVRSNDEEMPLLSVLGHVDNGWAAAGETWSMHDFAVTNVSDDGSVPDAPPLYWLEHNTFRTRPIIDATPVDLEAQMVDVCVVGCANDSLVRIAAQISNGGAEASPEGLGVTLYTSTPIGDEVIETVWLDGINAGAIVNLTFETTLTAIDGGDLYIRVDDIGTGSGMFSECEEDDNVAVWGAVTCSE